MENKVPDIIEKADQEGLVITELGIERIDIRLLRRDAEDDRAGVAGGEGQNGKHQKGHPKQHWDHIENPFDDVFFHW